MRSHSARLVFAFVLGLTILCRIGFEAGYAMADGSAGSGSAIASSGSGSGSAAVLPTSALPDPTAHPGQAISDIASAWKTGWPVGVLVAMFMLLELGAYAGKQKSITWLAWLGSGRVSVVLAGATAVVAAMIDKLAAGGAWAAVLGAAAAAALAIWHPAGTDPAKD